MPLPNKENIDEISASFSVQDCRNYSIPISPRFFDALEAHKDNKSVIGDTYRKMIGCLNFLTHCPRPDIYSAVCILSRYSIKPLSFILKRVKRVFWYWKLTKDYGLQYDVEQMGTDSLKHFCDANFAGNKIDRKSRSDCLGKWFCYTFRCNSRRQTLSSYPQRKPNVFTP